ncbi:hypothetical protein PA598K_04585 [Paenibacillus sp. 598K]|uniref:carbohydrate ABC transporter permease n=1 Tax=Paenibacillus sp. 598K TaxID=1117987 RepID=UPI000FFA13D4|nr:sugar ABC transporter permease [Paenibacillus sp. 598K]GBF76137.1 hypothetical protein PA598K_04585 [Paenibacillus sp. 598K]
MNAVFKRSIYWFMVPGLLVYVTFWILPILLTFHYSLTDTNGFGSLYNYVGLDNYRALLKDGTLVNSAGNTLQYTVASIILTNLLALGLALLLNAKLRLRGIYRTFTYLPTLFSTIVVGFIWGFIYLPDYGMLALLGQSVGFADLELNLLGDASTALWATVIVDVWKGFGGVMIIYLAGLQSVPGELVESAQIDGARSWHILRHIKLPLIAPAITINLSLGLVNGLKQFDYIYTMTQGGPGKSTRTLMFDMFRMAFTESQFGKAAALGVISFVFISIATFALVHFLRTKEVSA